MCGCELILPERRDVPFGERERGLGDRLGPLGARPGPGDDPVPWIGGLVDPATAGALAMIRAEPPDPRDDRCDALRPVFCGNGGPEPDEGVSSGDPLAVPASAAPDAQLDLHYRLEPVDVRALEQADLYEAHGSRRIATSR